MLWPNGQRSQGQLQANPQGLVFVVSDPAHDAVLSQRGAGKPCKPAHADRPAGLSVEAVHAAGESLLKPALPALQAATQIENLGGMQIGGMRVNDYGLSGAGQIKVITSDISSGTLAHAARLSILAGRQRPDEGMGGADVVIQNQLFGRILNAVAGQCSDPQAMRHVASALLAEDRSLAIAAEVPADRGGSWGSTLASFDTSALRTALEHNTPGQHTFIRCHLMGGAGDHALGIDFRNEADGQVRVSVINSNGWGLVDLNQPTKVCPAIFKSISVDEATAAMGRLLSGPLAAPRPEKEALWSDAGCGQVLMEWLSTQVDPAAKMSAYYHDPGQKLTTTRQKSGDCGMETTFALMASALPPADYKLAKAACLNALLEANLRMLPMASWPQWTQDIQNARQPLSERITSSLSGSLVAPTEHGHA